MVTDIKALNPASLQAQQFAYQNELNFPGLDFRLWAENNEAACFRQYVFEHIAWEPVGSSDLDVELRTSQVEFVMTYPLHSSLYTPAFSDQLGENIYTIENIIEEDLNLVAKTIGYRGGGNYVSGQLASIEQEYQMERLDGVIAAVLPLELQYYYSAD